MEEHGYAVSFMVHNKESKAWASKVTWTGTDEREAYKQYDSEQSRLLGSREFDVVNVYLVSELGLMESRVWDERPEEIDKEIDEEIDK